MRRMLAMARTRVGLSVMGGALLLAVGGTATAAVVTSTPATDEVAEVTTVEATPTASPTTEVTAPAPEPVPEQLVADTATPTVEPVTTPEPAPEFAPAPAPGPATAPKPVPAPQSVPAGAKVGNQSGDSYDPNAPYTDPAGTTYVPAPPVPVEPLSEERPDAPPPGDYNG
ncbi:hypothetical protein [Blastococcus mobilis]|uniref:Uncharacterized protein n=1 Tax=Blastococcus mobilis TaxID=1938746 RepID=A0A238VI49_9ACTN|nr:hypothetical protein [Blastococcus mobilis]SNR33169.1 hypothetical protein SAMN06272737_10399 [Blastococcus mobilis]